MAAPLRRLAVLQRLIAPAPASSDDSDHSIVVEAPASMVVEAPNSGRYATQRLVLITGNAHPELAQEVAASLGVKLSDARVATFKSAQPVRVF